MFAAIELPELSLAWAVVILALGYSLLGGWQSVRNKETDVQRANEIDRHEIAADRRDNETIEAMSKTIQADARAIETLVGVIERKYKDGSNG